MHDLIVSGAGPVGLAVAISAARRGWDVVLVDPVDGTIDKACGEGLMPAGVEILLSLGAEAPRHHEFDGIRYVRGPRHADGLFKDGPGWGIRRTELHRVLDEAAAKAGVLRVRGHITSVVQHDDRVEALGRKARWMVAADGLRSPMRQHLGLEMPRVRSPRFGIRRHFAVAPWSDKVEVHWADDAEAYVTPVDDKLIGVAFLFGESARTADQGSKLPPYERMLQRFPDLAERLVHPASAVRGAGPFGIEVSARVAGRVLLAGDAAGYLDPLTGEGIKLGMAGAMALVDCLHRGRPQDWEAAWHGLFDPYERATGRLLTITHPVFIRRVMVPFLRLFPFVFERVLDNLAH